jgi:hypothetical protein
MVKLLKTATAAYQKAVAELHAKVTQLTTQIGNATTEGNRTKLTKERTKVQVELDNKRVLLQSLEAVAVAMEDVDDAITSTSSSRDRLNMANMPKLVHSESNQLELWCSYKTDMELFLRSQIVHKFITAEFPNETGTADLVISAFGLSLHNAVKEEVFQYATTPFTVWNYLIEKYEVKSPAISLMYYDKMRDLQVNMLTAGEADFGGATLTKMFKINKIIKIVGKPLELVDLLMMFAQKLTLDYEPSKTKWMTSTTGLTEKDVRASLTTIETKFRNQHAQTREIEAAMVTQIQHQAFSNPYPPYQPYMNQNQFAYFTQQQGRVQQTKPTFPPCRVINPRNRAPCGLVSHSHETCFWNPNNPNNRLQNSNNYLNSQPTRMHKRPFKPHNKSQFKTMQALLTQHIQQLSQNNNQIPKSVLKQTKFVLPPESEVTENPTFALRTTSVGDYRA